MIRSAVLTVALVLTLVAFSSPSAFQLAHAGTGVVCLADPSTAVGSSTPCPSTPAIFDGPVGQYIRIGVFIQGSDGLIGFAVTLLANHEYLRPVSVDLTGTVLLGNYHTILECLGGNLVLGTTCASSDTIDTIDLAETSGIGLGNTATPTTGLLFTAIYQIVGTNLAESPISVGFQTGCSSTSVGSSTCVDVANGTTGPVDETIQSGATFDNSLSATMPVIAISASPDSLGPSLVQVASSTTITATAFNGFPDLAPDSVTFTTTAAAGVIATIMGENPCSTQGSSCEVSLQLLPSVAGNYSVSVLGTYSTLDSNGNPETLVGIASVSIVAWDFGISLSSSNLSVVAGSNNSEAVTVSSDNGFVGSVAISASNSVPAGLSSSLSANIVSLQGGETATVILTVSAPLNTTGNYRIQLRTVSQTRIKSATVSVIVTKAGIPDFVISAIPTSLVLLPNSSRSSVVSLIGTNGFSQGVLLTVNPSGGLSAVATPQNITGSGNATLTVSSGTIGNFTIMVTGTSGSISHTITIPVQVTSNPIGEVCIAPTGSSLCPNVPSAITATVGTQLRVSVLIQNSQFFNGVEITLLANHTILRPVGVDTTGTVMPSPYTIALECIGGIPVQGRACSLEDTLDTIHFAFVSSPNAFTMAPTTGLLFTAIYDVIGATSQTDIGFQPGCNSESSTVWPSCIEISNGISPFPMRETSQPAIFTTQSSPDFALTSSTPGVNTVLGSIASSSIFLTSLNGFNGNVALSVSPSSGSSVTASLSATMLSPISPISTLTVTSPTPNNNTLNVLGSSGAQSHSTSMIVQVTDFQIIASPSTLTTSPGVPVNSTISLVGIDGFSSQVELGVSTNPADGLNCALTSRLIGITRDSVNASILECSGVPGSYTTKVIATVASLTRTSTVTVNVVDFRLTASVSTITVAQGPPGGTDMITITSIGGFNGTVQLSAQFPNRFFTAFNPSTVFVSGSSLLTIDVSSPTTPGLYLVNVTATSGDTTHDLALAVTVTSNITLSPPFFSQTNWVHRFSLSKNSDLQTWKLGVGNNSTSTKLYFSITVTGVDHNGISNFVVTSPVFTLDPHKNNVGITLSRSFTSSQIGDTFSFSEAIHWGTTSTTDPEQLPFISTLTNGVPTSGTFTVLS